MHPLSIRDGSESPEISKNVVLAKLNQILIAGLEFHEWIWFGPREEVRKFLKEQPEEARYKFASFAKFFDRVMPVKVLHQSMGSRGRLKPEDLAKLNLSEKALMRLAGVEEEPKPEPEDVHQD